MIRKKSESGPDYSKVLLGKGGSAGGQGGESQSEPDEELIVGANQ